MGVRLAILGSLSVVAVAACSATTEFDPALLGEDNSLACADELDNDGDGLTDCQDLGCLYQASCCNVPTVVFEADFETDTCGPPDERDWNAWGAPLPRVCDGVFRPNKAESCYDVGAIAKQSVSLREGMTVIADVVGRPEPKGRLILALTFQSDILGALDPCAPIEALRPFVFMQQEPAGTGGYRWLAGYDQTSVGASKVVNDDAEHTVAIGITDDGYVEYVLDGEAFAVSSDARVVEVDRPAFVALAGRGFSAGFTNVSVVSGNQCETPDRWTPAEPFLALSDSGDYTFDALEVMTPTVVSTPGGELDMFFTGCDSQGTCDVGVAHSSGNGFVRDPANPIDIEPKLWWYRNPRLLAGRECAFAPDGIWDFCNRTGGFVDYELWEVINGPSILIWYGRRDADGIRRIGLFISNDDGASFEEIPDVVPLSSFDDIDGRGVRQPTVIYDPARQLYQMWFAAEGALGATTSIGYAVSADGIHWQRYPEPVVRADDVGLDSVGRPSVLFDGAKLRMFIEGTLPGASQRRIYELVNHGLPYDQLP